MYQNKNGMLLVILYVFIYWKVYNLNAIKPPTHRSGIYNAVNKLIYMYAFLYIYVLVFVASCQRSTFWLANKLRAVQLRSYEPKKLILSITNLNHEHTFDAFKYKRSVLRAYTHPNHDPYSHANMLVL